MLATVRYTELILVAWGQSVGQHSRGAMACLSQASVNFPWLSPLPEGRSPVEEGPLPCSSCRPFSGQQVTEDRARENLDSDRRE